VWKHRRSPYNSRSAEGSRNTTVVQRLQGSKSTVTRLIRAELSKMLNAQLLLACLKRKLFTKERRGLLIGSGRIPEPSILKN